MDQIIVSICTGKTCYTAGATLFKQLGLLMGAKVKSQVSLVGADDALTTDARLAPCVKVNGRLITQATPGDVMFAIRECLKVKKRPVPCQFVQAA
jgi:hypothetical protein